MNGLIIWLLALGSLLRLTRLITADRITAPIRAQVIKRYGPNSAPADLIGCAWCMSFWLSLPIAAFAADATGLGPAVIFPAALTGSWLAGIAADRIEK